MAWRCVEPTRPKASFQINWGPSALERVANPLEKPFKQGEREYHHRSATRIHSPKLLSRSSCVSKLTAMVSNSGGVSGSHPCGSTASIFSKGAKVLSINLRDDAFIRRRTGE